MHPAVREALGVLWPRECAGCGTPDHGVCGACAAPFEATRAASFGGTTLHWAVTYDGVARSVVLAAKEHGRRGATRVCAAALARLVRDIGAASAAPTSLPLLTVLVPPSREGLRRRGFAPVRVLARRAGLSAVELVADDGRQQKRQGREARLQRGGLRVARRDARRLAGARVVVVDDVVTSGATMRTAVLAARDAGAEVVAAVAIARVPRTHR